MYNQTNFCFFKLKLYNCLMLRHKKICEGSEHVATRKILRGKRARCDTTNFASEASTLRHKKFLPRCPPPYFRASSMPGGNLSSLTFNMLKNLYEVPNLSLQFLYYFYHQLSPGCVAKVEKRERESTVLQLDI